MIKYDVVIRPDNGNDSSPREWDNLGTIASVHRNYNLGDKGALPREDWGRLADPAKYVALPLYMYEHGGITISTKPFECPWDSGQLGFTYVSKEDVYKEYSVTRLTKKLRKTVEGVLNAEINTYDQFLRGDVYMYQLVNPVDGEVMDSCGGFYGDDFMTNGMEEYIPDEYHAQLKDAEVTYE
jgi:hypothetical protein